MLLRGLFTALINLVSFAAYFAAGILLFAVIEFESPGRGCLLGSAVVLAVQKQNRFTALIIYITELSLFIFVDIYLSHVAYAVLVMYWACPGACGTSTEEVVTVEFKPYEAEIRKFLMQKDPSKLHRVDDMLSKYNGDGPALFNALKEEFAAKEEAERKKYIRNVVQRGFS